MRKTTLLLAVLLLLISWHGNTQITTYPYLEDFESGNGGWVADNTTNGTWALGTPSATIINSADSGTNAWVTNLSGDYNNSENSWVQSPIFDFSGLSTPSIEFSIWWNSEFSWDGMVLQSSIDTGTTWQNVGAEGDPNNWYTDNTIGGNPGGQQEGWTGREAVTSNGSGSWVTARHALTGLGSQSNVIFRFAFGSDGSVLDEGIGFDTISIFEVTCPEPLDILVENILEISADISWTAGSTETAWEYVVQPAGTGVPTGSGISGSSTTVNETGLTSTTAYEVYVRADCDGSFSLWAGPFNFTTLITNDDCAIADVLTVNPPLSCAITTSGSLIGSLESTVDPSCDTGTEFDVWYSFVAPASGNVSFTVTLGTGNPLEYALFDACGGTELDCGDPLDSSLFVGLTPGIPYFLMVWNDGFETPGTFDICVTEVTCLAPSVLNTTATTSTSIDLGWTENGTATTWDIEWGLTDFSPTGIPTIDDTLTNPHNLSNLIAATSYDFYVRSDCGDSAGTSTWVGPFTFTTNFAIDCVVDPTNTSYCYENNDTNVLGYTSSDGSPLRLTFNSGGVENTFDELIVYDSDGVTELYNGYGTSGDISGLSFQSTGDTISFTIQSDESFSCASGNSCCSSGIDYTVTCATCINPSANYTVVDDCVNGGQFFVDVDITSLGDATSLTISDDQGSIPIAVSAIGITQFGPYTSLTPVITITINNNQDVNCVINSNTILGICPPINDECIDAIIAVVNDNESCALVTAGTIINATASGTPTGSCTGNPDDDVWFQFTALNDVQLISITNIVGGTPNMDFDLYEGTCGGLVELACSDDTASATPTLVVGNTYFVRVFSGGSNPETTTFDLCITTPPSNTVCDEAVNFCVGAEPVFPNTIGFPSSGQIACLVTTPNPTWNFIEIGNSGLVEIQINQVGSIGNDPDLDVDFVLWGPFASSTDFCVPDILDQDCGINTCPNNTSTTNPNFYPFGNIVDCSYDPASTENVTITNAISGEIYVLLITNFSQQPGTIEVTQTNISTTGSGATTGNIEVDLGDDQSFCGGDYTITANSPLAERYAWFVNGSIIAGETLSTLTVSETNTYTVIAYNDQCTASSQDDILVDFSIEAQFDTPIDEIVACGDTSVDGIEDFDLVAHISTFDFVTGQDASMFNISFHETFINAALDNSPLASPYMNTSNPQTVYVRFEDANDVSCRIVYDFDLIISESIPTATTSSFELCDDDSGDGIEDFDLTTKDAEILNGQDPITFMVSYYETETDANANAEVNAITSVYSNTSNPQTVWVRVENSSATDCFVVDSFDLIVNDLPLTTFTPDFDYRVCPPRSNSIITPIQIVATAENYSETEVSINWYVDGTLISGENSLTLPISIQGDYTIEVTFNNTGCTSIETITVTEFDNCVIPQGISPNGDGDNDTFDLSSYDVIRLEIFNRNGVLVYSKDNYRNEWYGQADDGNELPVGTYFYTMIYEGGTKQTSAWIYINN